MRIWKSDFVLFVISNYSKSKICISEELDLGDVDSGNTIIETTNAAQIGRTVLSKQDYAGVSGNVKIAGHVILNQCGTLLSRKNIK